MKWSWVAVAVAACTVDPVVTWEEVQGVPSYLLQPPETKDLTAGDGIEIDDDGVVSLDPAAVPGAVASADLDLGAGTTVGGAALVTAGQACPVGQVATGADATGALTCLPWRNREAAMVAAPRPEVRGEGSVSIGLTDQLALTLLSPSNRVHLSLFANAGLRADVTTDMAELLLVPAINGSPVTPVSCTKSRIYDDGALGNTWLMPVTCELDVCLSPGQLTSGRLVEVTWSMEGVGDVLFLTTADQPSHVSVEEIYDATPCVP